MEDLNELYRVRVILEVNEDALPYGKCNQSEAVYAYLKKLAYLDREHFVVICLNSKLEVNAISTVSIGTLNASIVHPREVFKVPILSNASGIIVAHNHPSGIPEPSGDDLAITRKLIECGDLFSIPVLDHLIIGDDHGGYYSMADSGLMPAVDNKYMGLLTTGTT